MKSKHLSQQDLQAYWMPFTPNRMFKKNPRMLAKAEGMYYYTDDGRKVLDGCSGLWCVNAGHGRSEIQEAISHQVKELDYATCFQMGSPIAFELAQALTKITPDHMNSVFYTNSGSESVDTALKIALAYHRLKGNASKTQFIGRSKAYHGVGFGGMSVGGLTYNRKTFGSLLSGVDHLQSPLNIEKNAFTKGMPQWGAHLAEELDELIKFHDASNVAAVIIEPVIGSGGVVPPPVGYLERIQEICHKNDVLLILDEVITGFGRVGDSFAANRFGLKPDLITAAKGLSNGNIPMGAVFASDKIYNDFMTGPEYAIEFCHGYTYSGHPLACAVAKATLDIYLKEGLFERAKEIETYFEDAIHSLQSHSSVVDIRNFGLMGGIEFDPIKGEPGVRAQKIFQKCFEYGATVRLSGEVVCLAPALIIEKEEIDKLVEIVSKSIKSV